MSSLKILYDFVHTKSSESPITPETLHKVLGLGEGSPKPILKLRLHQHISVLTIQKAIQKFKEGRGSSNKFLVGILPRGGKTYIAGGIVHALQPRRVVVLLGAKSETLTQFTTDLFSFFQNFGDYEVVNVLDVDNLLLNGSCEKAGESTIYSDKILPLETIFLTFSLKT
jgi:hypothetical protein